MMDSNFLPIPVVRASPYVLFFFFFRATNMARVPILLRKRLFVHQLLLFLCMTGCSYHLLVLSVQYFKYETSSTYSPYVPVHQRVPHVTACFTRAAGSTSSLDQHQNQQMNATSLVHDCSMRNFTSSSMIDSDCSSLFTVTRSHRINIYDCYTFKVIDKMTFISLEIASTLINKNLLYKFSLNSQSFPSNITKFLIHFDGLLYDELFQAGEIELWPRGKFLLVYFIYELIGLKAPYATDCVEHLPLKCMSDKLWSNPLCSRKLCHKILTVTYKFTLRATQEGVSIFVLSLGSPVELIKHTPRVQSAAYFISVFSALGFWCSFSVHSLLSRFWRQKSVSISPHQVEQWHFSLVNLSCRCGIDMSALSIIVSHRLSHEHDSRRKSSSRCIRLIVKSIIAFICIYEMISLTLGHTLFRTKMEISFDIRAPLEVPSLSYCFDLHAWLNITRPSLRLKNFDENMKEFSSSFNYTLADIFDSIPPTNSVIVSCQYREDSSSQLIDGTSHDCNKIFSVRKFYQNDFICYLFDPNLDYKLDVRFSSESDTPLDIIYSIEVSPAISRVRHIQPIISRGMPRSSRFHVERYNVEAHFSSISTTYLNYGWELMPAPYDTNCFNRPDGCRETCVRSSGIGLLSPSELFAEPHNESFVDYLNLSNVTASSIIQSIETRCDSNCKHQCKSDMTKTIVQLAFNENSVEEDSLEVVVTFSGFPVYLFVATPLYSFTDFMYQVICSLSFWLGFSFTGLLDRIFTRTNEALTSRLSFLSKLTVHLTRAVESRYKLTLPPVKDSNFCRKLIQFFHYFLIALGFFSCISVTIDYYLSYPVRIDTRLEPEMNYTGLYTNICITLDQLNLKNNYSLASIWSESPGVENLIVGCGVRGYPLKKLSHLPHLLQRRIMPQIRSSKLCARMFRVTKKITLGMVCYEMQPRGKERIFDVKNHIGDANMDHYFTLNCSMSRFALRVMMGRYNSQASILFGTRIEPVKVSEDESYLISHLQDMIDSLPHPYQTGNFSSFNQFSCIRRCVSSASIEKLHLFSSYGEIDHVIQLNHETPEDSVATSAILQSCALKCSRHHTKGPLRSIYFDTFSEGPWHNGHFHANATKTLEIYGSGYLVAYTKLYPRLKLIDLLLFIGSIYSLFFGVSVFHLVDLSSSGRDDSSHHSLLRQLEDLRQLTRHCSWKRLHSTHACKY